MLRGKRKYFRRLEFGSDAQKDVPVVLVCANDTDCANDYTLCYTYCTGVTNIITGCANGNLVIKNAREEVLMQFATLCLYTFPGLHTHA